jgi:hypothetical protein
LLSVIGVAAVSAGFLQLSSAITNRQITALDNRRAFYLAEAGLAEAYHGLLVGKSGQVGFDKWPATYGDGVFWVNVEAVSATAIRFVSSAMCDSGRATLSMVVESQAASVASLGIFSDVEVAVEPFSLIDSYDSTVASYPVHLANNLDRSNARFGSDGNIHLNGPPGSLGQTLGFGESTSAAPGGTEILGDAVPGVSGTLSMAPGVTVSGSTAPRSAEVALPQVEVPPLEPLPAVIHTGAVPMLIPAAKIAYQGIHLTAGSALDIRGPATVVIGKLESEADTEIVFDTSAGKIDLYITGGLEVAQSKLTNTSETPSTLNVLVSAFDPETGGDAVHLGRTDFHGTIYAPNGTVACDSGFALFGAVAARRLALAENVGLHYDVSLASNSSQTSMAKLVSWRVVSIPKEAGLVRLSPFHLTGIRPEQLPTPGRSHDLTDVSLTITYVDLGGTTLTYSGIEDLFDWTQVKSVVSKTRTLISDHNSHACADHWSPSYMGQNPGSTGSGYQGNESFGVGSLLGGLLGGI